MRHSIVGWGSFSVESSNGGDRFVSFQSRPFPAFYEERRIRIRSSSSVKVVVGRRRAAKILKMD